MIERLHATGARVDSVYVPEEVGNYEEKEQTRTVSKCEAAGVPVNFIWDATMLNKEFLIKTLTASAAQQARKTESTN